jgi:hypothetical protein
MGCITTCDVGGEIAGRNGGDDRDATFESVNQAVLAEGIAMPSNNDRAFTKKDLVHSRYRLLVLPLTLLSKPWLSAAFRSVSGRLTQSMISQPPKCLALSGCVKWTFPINDLFLDSFRKSGDAGITEYKVCQPLYHATLKLEPIVLVYILM